MGVQMMAQIFKCKKLVAIHENPTDKAYPGTVTMGQKAFLGELQNVKWLVALIQIRVVQNPHRGII